MDGTPRRMVDLPVPAKEKRKETKMRILVTGHKGVIGTHLLEYLQDHEILGLDKNSLLMERIGNVTSYERDISLDDIAEEISTFKPELVFHLAASFERTEETPEAFHHVWQNDTWASHRLIKILSDLYSVKRIIFASSYLIYGLNSRHIDPRNLCGVSKLYTERELEFMSRKKRPDITYVNARIYRVYGVGSKSIISRWCLAKYQGHKSCLYNPDNEFDFIHAKDVAEALYRLAFTPKAKGIIDVGTGVKTSIKKVIDLIGINPRRIEDDSFTESSAADTTKLHELTEWTPKITIEQGIKEHDETYSRNQ